MGIRIRGRSAAIVIVSATLVSLLLVPGTSRAGFPGGNGNIVFASHDGSTHLYTVRPSGKDLTYIRYGGADPAWSPDGKRIAFTDRTDDSETAVFTVRADGTRLRRITPEGLGAYEPAWSPDGRRLVFTVAESELWGDLYTIDIDGKNPTRLTDLSGYEFMAAWSPDGQRIAFVMNDPLLLTSDIYTVKPDGTDLRQVTATPLETKHSPGWSPDGMQLVFERFEIAGTQADLFVIGADGSGQEQITDTPWQEQWPSFSPDGTRLLFGSDKDGDWDIYTMRTDSSGLRKLTNNTSDERVADWRSVRV